MSVIIGGMKMKQTNVTISGHVEPGFEAVREAFIENFTPATSSGPPVASTTVVKKWLTCGAAFGTSELQNPGKKIRW